MPGCLEDSAKTLYGGLALLENVRLVDCTKQFVLVLPCHDILYGPSGGISIFPSADHHCTKSHANTGWSVF